MAFATSICNSKLISTEVVSCGSITIASSSLRCPALRPLLGRRVLVSLFFSTATALPAVAATAPADDSRSLLLQKYLKKSEENKTKNDKEEQNSARSDKFLAIVVVTGVIVGYLADVAVEIAPLNRQTVVDASAREMELNQRVRLDSYYKRNYKDYFELFEGSLNGKDELSDTEKGILDWLQKNK